MHTIYDDPLPEGWLEEPLGSLVVTKRGCSWSKEQERERANGDTVPVVRIPNIKASLDLTDLLYLERINDDQRAASAVSKGWTLMVGSNGNPKRIGDSVLVDQDREMVFASFLFALRPRPDDGRLTDEFLACWLQAHRVHEFISETSQMTTGLANMSWSACRKLPVRFPRDLEEQRKITKALTAADDHIQAIEEQTRKAKRVKRGLLQTFPCAIRHGNGEPLFRFADICSGFTKGRDLSGSPTVTVAYLTVVNVLDGSLDLAKVSSTEIKISELDDLRLVDGDILMTEGGDRDKLGRGCIWEGQLDPIVCQNHIFRVRLDKDRLRPWFLHYLLQTPSSKRYFFSAAKQTSNLCTINSRDLRRFRVPQMKTIIQDECCERMKACDSLVQGLERQIGAARRLRQSLLQNLLTGKMRLTP